MKLLGGGQIPFDENLYKLCAAKLEKGDIKTGDLRDGFTFFAQVCNDEDDIRYEIQALSGGGAPDLHFQFNLSGDGGIFTVVFGGGFCETYEGPSPRPTVIFNISAQTVLDIVKGNV